MSIIAIAAYDNNFGMGFKNDLPWPKISEDLKRFKEITNGTIVIMGRKTWDSLKHKKLHNRINVVVSSGLIQGSPDMVTDLIGVPLIKHIKAMYGQNISVIGGSTIYKQMLPYCDILYTTKINKTYECDTFFPHSELTNWKKVLFTSFNSSNNLEIEYVTWTKQSTI